METAFYAFLFLIGAWQIGGMVASYIATGKPFQSEDDAAKELADKINDLLK